MAEDKAAQEKADKERAEKAAKDRAERAAEQKRVDKKKKENKRIRDELKKKQKQEREELERRLEMMKKILVCYPLNKGEVVGTQVANKKLKKRSKDAWNYLLNAKPRLRK